MYLIPIAYTGDGKIPMEYRLWDVKRDMRRSFCKKHEGQWLSFPFITILVQQYGMKLKADVGFIRVLAPSGKIARAFYKEISCGESPHN